MSGRLRAAAGRTGTTAQDEGRYAIPGLEFNQALTWRAGKALPVADLLTRLQNLGSELRSLEQGQIPAKEFRQLAQDLAHSNLLGHKDKGIRAWTLCCIVDILNICAPDAPFHPAQLRDIFKVVNNLLQNLDDPSNAYNAQHVYILDSLTDTKSIVLVTDLEKSEELITPLFRICFDIVSGASQNASGQELAKSVEFQLRSMLVTIIDEANLPHEAIDVILSQYLRVDPRTQQVQNTKGKKQDIKDKKQDTLHLKDYPPAYNMAKSICTTCTEKMTAYVTQYVGTIIMNSSVALTQEVSPKHHGRITSELENSDDDDDDDESLTDLRKAHRLVRELWRACPDVLINVIPQIEAELHADAVALRQLATETLGDIIAGIGISGPPPTAGLDPNVYPLPSIHDPEPDPLSTNPLLVPASPKPFGSIHSSAFRAFLGRRIDKSPLVRYSWTSAVSRVLLTGAGGIGISSENLQILLSGYEQMLRDIDDKVRYVAVRSIRDFNYHMIVNVLAADGGLAAPRTVLSTLADRVTDKRFNVREEAISVLGHIWGVASRDVLGGVEKVTAAVADGASRICNAMYVNDLHIHMQLDKSLYENLLPLGYPPVKSATKSDNQKRGKGSSQDSSSVDADYIRVERILTLVHVLDVKAKQVFFGIQKRQVEMSKVMKGFLKACEDYNGGVVDDESEEHKLKEQLTKYIQAIAKQYPDSNKASTDLWKFVKMHDRRNYQLIRFATGPEHDYRTMSKAIKELTKRIREGNANVQSTMDTLRPLVYRCALIVYNRSHVPAIMEISRKADSDLSETAHEVLKEISARNPEVLKTHIQALCKELEDRAPTASRSESASAADTLKACAGFARKYPGDVPTDRKFLAAMMGFALYSKSPRAAKHATTIILTVSNKKELHAKDLISQVVQDCTPDSPHYLARLATMSQVCLLAPTAATIEEDAISEIAVENCLKQNLSPAKKDQANTWDSVPDDETVAKELALKVMVNRCRSGDDKTNQSGFDVLAQSVMAVLMQLIENDGEVTPSEDTPPAQRNHLRLTAARYVLKLCSHKRRCEDLVTPQMFIAIALIAINPPNAVRNGFIRQLQKYLGQSGLHQRWYTVCFLLAFEPDVELKSRTVAWLKSRVAFYGRQRKSGNSAHVSPDKTSSAQHTVMENTFARLLSLLAHHPDYPDPQAAEFESELLDFAKYMIFYLQCVVNEDNISLVFHIAQRVKQTRDAVTSTTADDASERLYVLSDLAQAVIRNFADQMPAHAKGINLLQTWPGKVALPNSLFAALSSSAVAQEIAAKNYLPEDVALGLDKLVRHMNRGARTKERPQGPARTGNRKRASEMVNLDDSDVERVKRVKKTSILPIRRTPKSVKRKNRDEEDRTGMSIEQPSRKSARMSAVKSYAESDEDDEAADTDTEDGGVVSSPIKATRKARTASKQAPRPVAEMNVSANADESEAEPESNVEIADAEAQAAVVPEDAPMSDPINDDHDTEVVARESDDNIDAASSPPSETAPNSDQLEAEADGAETTEDHDEGEEDRESTPSPKPKSMRATRGTTAATKLNGTSKPTQQTEVRPRTKTKTKTTAASKGEVKAKAAIKEADKPINKAKKSNNAASAVSKLNAIAGGAKGKGKGKVKKQIGDAHDDNDNDNNNNDQSGSVTTTNTPTTTAAGVATRRSTRTKS